MKIVNRREQLSAFSVGFSFVPFFGVLGLLVASYFGSWKVHWLRYLMLFSLLVNGVLIYIFSDTKYFSKSVLSKNSQSIHKEVMLNDFVCRVELYQRLNGNYPEKLSDISYHPSLLAVNQGPTVFYKKTGDGYILLDVGNDLEPFTNDDLYPRLGKGNYQTLGFQVRKDREGGSGNGSDSPIR